MLMRAVFAALFALLASAIIWASLSASLGESLLRTLADPWGVVMLIDLYVGFVIAIAIIALFERPLAVILIALATCLLGNLVILAWLLWRGWALLRSRAESAPHAMNADAGP